MDDKNLEKLKKRLYKKDESFEEREKERKFRLPGGRQENPPTDWQYSYEELEKESKAQKILPTKIFPMKKLFIIALIIFVISAAAVAFFLFNGLDIISSRNIDLALRGPVNVMGGERASLEVMIENKNNTALELVDLLVEFPVGVSTEENPGSDRERYSLDRIDPKQSAKKIIKLNIFGEKDEIKNIKVILEYRMEGSNAIFAKEAHYEVKITHPAVGISVSLPKEINSKEEMKIETQIISNAEVNIKDLMVQIDYPSGFQFTKAEPAPHSKNNIWELGDLSPNQQRSITIYGKVEGQDLEERVFRVQAGVMNKDDTLISYGSSASSVIIKRPFLDLKISLNGEDKENNVISPGQSVRGEIVWKNNLSSNVTDATIEMKIKGNALDEKSISSSKGTYRAFDKTIVWNSSVLPALSAIKPGDTGREVFSFYTLSSLPISGAGDKNFSITIEAIIKGKTSSENLGEKEIANIITKEVKVASFLQLASHALHYSGDFKNSGPMPPKVGSETTYTVVWSIGNTSNDFSGVKVRAVLPSYVRWLGNTSPAGSNFSFNEQTGEVIWDIGDVPAATGILLPAKKSSFQISFMPSPSQVMIVPILVSNIKIEGKDNFTSTTVEDVESDLDTNLLNDPKFRSQEARVVE